MAESKVILSFPFSGSLYAFFEDQLFPERGPDKMLYHPYYRTLFGSNYKELYDITMTLTIIFDKIYMAPADNALPDTEKYLKGGVYDNPEIGMWSNWDDFLNKKTK